MNEAPLSVIRAYRRRPKQAPVFIPRMRRVHSSGEDKAEHRIEEGESEDNFL